MPINCIRLFLIHIHFHVLHMYLLQHIYESILVLSIYEQLSHNPFRKIYWLNLPVCRKCHAICDDNLSQSWRDFQTLEDIFTWEVSHEQTSWAFFHVWQKSGLKCHYNVQMLYTDRVVVLTGPSHLATIQ